MPTADTGDAGKRAVTKARNRAAILAAARKVFATHGYEAATVRDIVRSTDLAVGTFYGYFNDKAEVFASVAEEALAELRARLRKVRTDRSQPFETRVLAAYRAYFEFVVEERPLFDLITRNLDALPQQRAEADMSIGIRELKEDLLPDLADRELAPSELDYLAAAAVGLGNMVARRMVIRRDDDADAAAALCARFFLAGLSGVFTAQSAAGALAPRNDPDPRDRHE